MDAPNRRYLVLENGRVFGGFAFGADAGSTGEVVFTTGMTGYTETLTDHSYAGQIVVQTFPLIGNYGVNPADFQSAAPALQGYIVKEWCQSPSHFACAGTLDTFLCAHGVPGLWGIDTRALTKLLRSEGTLQGALVDDPVNMDFKDCNPTRHSGVAATVNSPAESAQFHVAILDFGVKNSIIRALNERGCGVTLIPADATAAQILAEKPDGIVLSGGPGDPRELGNIIENIQALMRADIPIFGVGLGHQLLAITNGAEIEKLKYGHRGSNIPVRDNRTGRIYITSQNHYYAVKWDGARYVNVNDGSCEGLDYENSPWFSVRLLGARPDTIDKAEDRQIFKDTMLGIGQPCIPSVVVHDVDAAVAFAGEIGYPVIVRPAFTLGGTGGGFCHEEAELREICAGGLRLSPIHQALIEKSVAGWKEIEFEVIRDRLGNAITVCSMENVDPVGVHTGDSIVVGPALTLANREYQMLRTAALDIVTALGVEGGCNVQFALHPTSYEYAVIEVNPRVSRSSALASKATGYPIAKVATKIAIGFTLDEIPNAVTGVTKACFEPAIDYVALKFPKWPFDKFIFASRKLGTQMKATGEVMSLGDSFENALMKAVRGVEISRNTLRVVVLGSGPIRIGQGIEFDYASVHCVRALRKITCVSMGNPHCVLFFGDNPDGVEVERIGPMLEYSELFPPARQCGVRLRGGRA